MHGQTLCLVYEDFYLAIGSTTQQLIYQSDEEKKISQKKIKTVNPVCQERPDSRLDIAY